MTEDEAKSWERVDKLRALAANNPNEHEAASATAKADAIEAKLGDRKPAKAKYEPFNFDDFMREHQKNRGERGGFTRTAQGWGTRSNYGAGDFSNNYGASNNSQQHSYQEKETESDENIINAVEQLAKKYYRTADALLDVVNKCRKRNSARGIDEMVAYAFNATQYEPRYGGAGGLPIGKHPVTITATAAKPTQDGSGGFIEFTLTAFDGPAKGQSQADRLNLHNKSEKAVNIANQQLAAYCAVTGVFTFNDTDELIGKPFIVEIRQQIDNPNYTEVAAIFDMNGNEPRKAGAGPVTGGVANGGFPNGNGGQPNPPADQGNQQQGNSQGGNAGAWGQGNSGQSQQGQQGGGNAGNAGGGSPWGQQGGNTGGGNAGGQPGWGQR